MNIPSKIRIGSCDYIVNFTEDNLIVDSKVCYATIYYNNHKIEIDNKTGDQQLHELSLLHELLHGIVKERNLLLKDDEELIVEELARGLHQVIRDNPKIFINAEI